MPDDDTEPYQTRTRSSDSLIRALDQAHQQDFGYEIARNRSVGGGRSRDSVDRIDLGGKLECVLDQDVPRHRYIGDLENVDNGTTDDIEGLLGPRTPSASGTTQGIINHRLSATQMAFTSQSPTARSSEENDPKRLGQDEPLPSSTELTFGEKDLSTLPEPEQASTARLDSQIFAEPAYQEWLEIAEFDKDIDHYAVREAYKRHRNRRMGRYKIRKAIRDMDEKLEAEKERRRRNVFTSLKIEGAITDDQFHEAMHYVNAYAPWDGRADPRDTGVQLYVIRFPRSDAPNSSDPNAVETVFGCSDCQGDVISDHQHLQSKRHQVQFLPGNADSLCDAKELYVNCLEEKAVHLNTIAEYWRQEMRKRKTKEEFDNAFQEAFKSAQHDYKAQLQDLVTRIRSLEDDLEERSHQLYQMQEQKSKVELAHDRDRLEFTKNTDAFHKEIDKLHKRILDLRVEKHTTSEAATDVIQEVVAERDQEIRDLKLEAQEQANVIERLTSKLQTERDRRILDYEKCITESRGRLAEVDNSDGDELPNRNIMAEVETCINSCSVTNHTSLEEDNHRLRQENRMLLQQIFSGRSLPSSASSLGYQTNNHSLMDELIRAIGLSDASDNGTLESLDGDDELLDNTANETNDLDVRWVETGDRNTKHGSTVQTDEGGGSVYGVDGAAQTGHELIEHLRDELIAWNCVGNWTWHFRQWKKLAIFLFRLTSYAFQVTWLALNPHLGTHRRQYQYYPSWYHVLVSRPNMYSLALDALTIAYLYAWLAILAERNFWHGPHRYRRAYAFSQRTELTYWGTAQDLSWFPDLRWPVVRFFVKEIWNFVSRALGFTCLTVDHFTGSKEEWEEYGEWAARRANERGG